MWIKYTVNCFCSISNPYRQVTADREKKTTQFNLNKMRKKKNDMILIYTTEKKIV